MEELGGDMTQKCSRIRIAGEYWHKIPFIGQYLLVVPLNNEYALAEIVTLLSRESDAR